MGKKFYKQHSLIKRITTKATDNHLWEMEVLDFVYNLQESRSVCKVFSAILKTFKHFLKCGWMPALKEWLWTPAMFMTMAMTTLLRLSKIHLSFKREGWKCILTEK